MSTKDKFIADSELEKEIHCYLIEFHDRDTTVSDVARHFAQWQKEQIVDKACEWLKSNIELEKYKTPDEESYRHGMPYDCFEMNMFIEDFKKAMNP